MSITDILDQISGWLALILAAQWLAQFIVNLTPTPKDDRFVGKFYRFVEVLAGVISRTAKELPGERLADKPEPQRLRDVPDQARHPRPTTNRPSAIDDALGPWGGTD